MTMLNLILSLADSNDDKCCCIKSPDYGAVQYIDIFSAVYNMRKTSLAENVSRLTSVDTSFFEDICSVLVKLVAVSKGCWISCSVACLNTTLQISKKDMWRCPRCFLAFWCPRCYPDIWCRPRCYPDIWRRLRCYPDIWRRPRCYPDIWRRPRCYPVI